MLKTEKGVWHHQYVSLWHASNQQNIDVRLLNEQMIDESDEPEEKSLNIVCTIIGRVSSLWRLNMDI